MSWEITVVPDTFPALSQAGVVIPGERHPRPPARQLAVLDSYSRDNNNPETIVADLSRQDAPGITAEQADHDLQAVTEFYRAVDAPHAVAIAIEKCGHLAVESTTDNFRLPLWEPLSAPTLVQTGLERVATGRTYGQHNDTTTLLLDHFGVNGLGAAMRRAHELGCRVTPPQRAVFALPIRRKHKSQTVPVSAGEKLLLNARISHETEEEVAEALTKQGESRVSIYDVKQGLQGLRGRRRFDAESTVELLAKAVILKELPAERMPGPVPALLQATRRLRILAYAACGLSNSAIAEKVGVSEDSVKSSLKVGFRLLGEITGREQLMRAGMRAGIFVVGRFVEAR